MKDERIIAELESVRNAADDKLLHPEQVVTFARDPETKLHKHFEWDDTAAAEKYRVDQARQLIRVVVTTLPNSKREVQIYCSLPDDQHNGGGYRVQRDVMADMTMRAFRLAAARREMELFAAKYSDLTELAPIIAAFADAGGAKGMTG